MSRFPRRLSFRGPGAIQYHPDEPLPPEVSDTERERALDARWAVWDALDSVVERYSADLYPEGVGLTNRPAIDGMGYGVSPGSEGYETRLDDAGLRSEERETVMRGEEA